MSRAFTASAPGRCGIVGNPSDIYGGVVVSASIPARAVCRIVMGEPGEPPSDTRLLDAVLARFPLEGPFRVEWQTDVPRSSGLSGSTALLAATLGAVLQARSEADRLADPALAGELVRDIERNEAGIACGWQDAVMIVRGGLQRMDFAGKHPVRGGPAPVCTPLQTGLQFLLVTTGVERLSGSVHGPIIDRWLSGEADVVQKMERVAELGRLGAEAVASNDASRLAELMTENHEIQASLGGSGEAIDALIADCRTCGALAAKLAGAGLGGTVISLTDDPDGLEAKLRAKGRTRIMRPAFGSGLTLG
ncbi:MAG: hypothetical protein MH204_00405 [Fimbriimonadaceae bacterium]|nr:hypothetical protein [Fimbriimonadaceae bacterium]